MNSQSQGTYSLSSNLPVKRKRGRPRKDEGPLHGENKTLPSGSVCANDVDDDMVGQVVTGVIEGSFDAGYLLNVKVGSIGSNLRGVVFLPGRCSPITAANDVAPHTKMYERKEIPIPICNPPTLLNSTGSPPGDSKQCNKQTVEIKTFSPPLPSQTLPIDSKLNMSMTPEKPSGIFVGTLDESLQKNGGNMDMDSNMPNQIQEPEITVQSVSAVEHTNSDKLTLPNEVSQDCGVSTVVKVPDMDLKVNEASGSEPVLEPVSTVIETLIKESPNQHLALNIVQKQDELVDDGIKIPELDSNQTSLISEAEQNNELGKLIEKKDSPKTDALLQSEMQIATENLPVEVMQIATENTPIERAGGDDVCVSEFGLPSAAETNQPLGIIEQDAVVAPKLALEVFYCPGLFESQPCIASAPVSAMECDVKDSIEKSVGPEFTEPQLCISAGTATEMECDVKDRSIYPPFD